MQARKGLLTVVILLSADGKVELPAAAPGVRIFWVTDAGGGWQQAK